MKRFFLLATVLALGACGGGGQGNGSVIGGGDDGTDDGADSTGVPGSTLLRNLTQAQTDALCHEAAELYPQMSVHCSDGSILSRGNDDGDCTGADRIGVNSTCTATVSNFMACQEAIYAYTDAQVCNGVDSYPSACQYLDTCDVDSGS